MMQTARPHPTAQCRCGRPALLVHTQGTQPTVHLECPRCSLRTARMASEDAALADWTAGHVQPIPRPSAMPLVTPATLGSARSLTTIERERNCLALCARTPRMAA